MVRDLAFNVAVANRYGVDGAILLHHLTFWVYRNECNGKNFHDGKYWTYNSYATYSELFPMYNAAKIKRILKKLEAAGAIEVGNYNKASFDRTNWYTVTQDVYDLYNASDKDEPSTEQIRPTSDANSSKQYQVTTQVTNSVDYTDEELLKVLPDHTCLAVWHEYVQHRKELKKKLTPLAYKKSLRKAIDLAQGSPGDFKEIITQSISNGWQGIFDIKRRKGFDGSKFETDRLRDWVANGG